MGTRRKAEPAPAYYLVYWAAGQEERAPVDSVDEATVLARYLERNRLGVVDRLEGPSQDVAVWRHGSFEPRLEATA
jgi:hypothetical protein